MELNEYQEKAKKTILPTSENIGYLTMGLVGEAGEVANKVKKFIRGDYSFEEMRKNALGELGDVLWYVATLSDFLGFTLQEVADYNISKLAKRKEHGKIIGDGDSR